MIIAAPGGLPVEPQSVLAAVERQFRFVPHLGREGCLLYTSYTVIFDSNLTRYGGTQTEENRRILPVPREYGSFDQYAELELAPYSVLYLRYDVQPD